MNAKFLILMVVINILPLANSVDVENEEPVNVIHSYFEDLNKKQWVNATSWWVNKSKEDLLGFIADKENQTHKRGLLNIKEADLVMWKELPYEYAQQYLPTRYVKKYKNPKVYYVGVNYQVYSQNEFFIDGMNYFLITIVQEDGKWKIALINDVPVSSMISDGYGFGTKDEKNFDARRIRFYHNESNGGVVQ